MGRDELPGLRPIGTVRTDPDADVVIQARYAPVTRGVVELDPALAPALDGLARFDWAWLVTLLDRTTDPRDRLESATDAGATPDDALRPVPFLLAARGERVGIFASRYPARPNRLGLSLVRIERVLDHAIEFSGVDVFDGTPVLDVKPWVSAFDLPSGASAPGGIRCGWFDTLAERPMTLDDPAALVLVARELAGRSAMAVRTVALDGLGASAPGELAIFDRHGPHAGRVLRGALDDQLTAMVGRVLDDPVEASRAHLVDLAVDDDGALAAGLTCNGRAQVVVQPVDHVPSAWWEAVATRQPVALVTDLDAVGHGAVVDLAHPHLDTGRSRGAVEEHDGRRLLVEVTIPVTHVVVVGTAALADELADLAHWLEWTAVPRDPESARAELAGLGARDAVIVLDHGLAATGPLLADALRAPVGYVGALGSRRTQERRAEHLRGLGVDDAAIARLHGPAGLDLGPTTAREIALAIFAEVTAVRAGRGGRPLRETTERIMR